MLFSDIRPFVRYVHFLPIGKSDSYVTTRPLDNRLFFVHAGAVSISVEDNICALKQNDAIIIPSGLKYRLISPEKTATYIGVNFDYTQENSNEKKPINPVDARNFFPDMLLERVFFNDIIELNSVLIVKGAAFISDKLLELEKEYSSRLLCSELTTSALLTDIITRLVRSARGVSLTESAFISNVLTFVKENLSRRITNRDIALAFNMHPNYVSSLVKSYTGMPLHQYLMNARIAKSMELLSRGTSVGEAALGVGFADIYHFSKAFKRITGISPSEYA